MVRMFVRHTVADYDAWRTEYDAFEDTRQSAGVTGTGVYRNAMDRNEVTAYHDFDSLEAAQALAGSNDLREAMGRAGVVGAPQVWFTEQV